MNKPKIYAYCNAGCKWETIHKSDVPARYVYLTKAEYDELTEYEDDVMYFVYDEGHVIATAATTETVSSVVSANDVSIEIVPSGAASEQTVEVLPAGSLSTDSKKSYLLVGKIKITDNLAGKILEDTITIPLCYKLVVNGSVSSTSYVTINYGRPNSASSEYELETICLKVFFTHAGAVLVGVCYKKTSTTTVLLREYKVIVIV